MLSLFSSARLLDAKPVCRHYFIGKVKIYIQKDDQSDNNIPKDKKRKNLT